MVIAPDEVHTRRVRLRRWWQLIAVVLYGLLYWYQWVLVGRVKQGDGLEHLGVALQTFPGLPVGLLLRDRAHFFGTVGAVNTAAVITVVLALIVWEGTARRVASNRRARSTSVTPSGPTL
jgi:hypothetical protein